MSVITCRSNQLRRTRDLCLKEPAEAFYSYVGGSSGAWTVTELTSRRGRLLEPVTHVDIIQGPPTRLPQGASWILSGIVRQTRYVSLEETLTGNRFGRSTNQEPTCAALIPILHSAEWWELGDATRQQMVGMNSRAATRGLSSLSAMIYRWQHGQDLSKQFDSVTWFEYEPRDSNAFEELLRDLRGSVEWKYVDRECDIRLVRSR